MQILRHFFLLNFTTCHDRDEGLKNIKKSHHNNIFLRWAGHQTVKNQFENNDIFTLQMLSEYDSICTAVLYHLYVDLSTCLFVRYIIAKQSTK